jgi:hypothetical protein
MRGSPAITAVCRNKAPMPAVVSHRGFWKFGGENPRHKIAGSRPAVHERWPKQEIIPARPHQRCFLGRAAHKAMRTPRTQPDLGCLTTEKFVSLMIDPLSPIGHPLSADAIQRPTINKDGNGPSGPTACAGRTLLALPRPWKHQNFVGNYHCLSVPGGRFSRPRPINGVAMPYPSTSERARAAVFCRRGNPRLFRIVTNAGLAPVHCRRTGSQPLDHTKR